MYRSILNIPCTLTLYMRDPTPYQGVHKSVLNIPCIFTLFMKAPYRPYMIDLDFDWELNAHAISFPGRKCLDYSVSPMLAIFFPLDLLYYCIYIHIYMHMYVCMYINEKYNKENCQRRWGWMQYHMVHKGPLEHDVHGV